MKKIESLSKENSNENFRIQKYDNLKKTKNPQQMGSTAESRDAEDRGKNQWTWIWKKRNYPIWTTIGGREGEWTRTCRVITKDLTFQLEESQK